VIGKLFHLNSDELHQAGLTILTTFPPGKDLKSFISTFKSMLIELPSSIKEKTILDNLKNHLETFTEFEHQLVRFEDRSKNKRTLERLFSAVEKFLTKKKHKTNRQTLLTTFGVAQTKRGNRHLGLPGLEKAPNPPRPPKAPNPPKGPGGKALPAKSTPPPKNPLGGPPPAKFSEPPSAERLAEFKRTACKAMTLNGSCTRDNCWFSHEQGLINKAKSAAKKATPPPPKGKAKAALVALAASQVAGASGLMSSSSVSQSSSFISSFPSSSVVMP